MPIIKDLKDEDKSKKGAKIVFKRSMKYFTKGKWKECLTGKEWEKLARTENIEEMTMNFKDDCTQIKKFKINNHYKHGLTKKIKEQIQAKKRNKKITK